MLASNRNPNVKERMMFLLPSYYADSTIVNAIIGSQAKEVEKLNHDVSDVLDQFFIDTATWGLASWERICDIPTDLSLDIDIRRSRLKGRLRGAITTTIPVIKSVAESYKHGEVEVEENNSDYVVIITFVSKYGIPSNLEAIKTTLFEIIPAHLNIEFRFTWLTWDELEAKNATWDMIETQNGTGMTWDQLEIWQ